MTKVLGSDSTDPGHSLAEAFDLVVRVGIRGLVRKAALVNEELLGLLRQLVVIVLRDPHVTDVLADVLAQQQRGHAAGGEMLTTGEAARIAKVKASTIRTWVREELLKAQRVGPRGRALRIVRSDLEAFLRSGNRRRTKPESPEAWARREVARALAKRGDRPTEADGLRLVGKP